MSDDIQHIDYPALMRRALAGLVPLILSEVAERGLPGGHHFYISFATDADGVVMPDHLRAANPEEMTIVLQHKFEDLRVLDDKFTLRLFFSGIPAEMEVPFAALIAFIDPHAGFRLQLAAPVGHPAEPPEEQEEKPKKRPIKPGGDVVQLDAFRRPNEDK